MAYQVLFDELRSNGLTYSKGAALDLGDSQAGPLLAIGAIAPIAQTAPAAPDNPGDQSQSQSQSDPTKVSVNSATAEELTALDLIGPATANRIIGGRPYESLEAVRTASKLSEAQWVQIADQLEL